jgi:hypothetical protein
MPPVDPQIVEKLKKLIEHQNSAAAIGSQKEAEAFASKVQELLSKYKLSMSDVEARVEEEAGVGKSSVPLVGKKGERNALLDKPGIYPWLWTLASTIANCNDCMALVSPTYKYVPYNEAQKRLTRLQKELAQTKQLVNKLGFGGHAIKELEDEIALLRDRSVEVTGYNTYVFVGVETDRLAVVELYKYFYVLCWEMAIQESDRHREEFRSQVERHGEGNVSKITHEFRHSFCQGFANAVSSRLREQREAMLAKAAQASNTCSALMVVDRRALMVKDWMKTNAGDGHVGAYKAGDINTTAYAAGVAMGQQVNLNGRAIGQ